jgi:hypothetical protein
MDGGARGRRRHISKLTCVPPRTVSELFVAFFSSTKVEMKSSGGLYLNSDLFFFPIIAKVSELLNAISN